MRRPKVFWSGLFKQRSRLFRKSHCRALLYRLSINPAPYKEKIAVIGPYRKCREEICLNRRGIGAMSRRKSTEFAVWSGLQVVLLHHHCAGWVYFQIKGPTCHISEGSTGMKWNKKKHICMFFREIEPLKINNRLVFI